jgi:hypothetical protein
MSVEVSNQFYLPKTPAELPSINDGIPTLGNLQQITPMRSCIGKDFPNGAIKFQFAVPPNERGKINEAYLRMRLSLKVANRAGNAWIQPKKSFNIYNTYTVANPPIGTVCVQDGHDITFSENPVANMFQSCVFRAGGQTVSECQAFQPQVDTMVRRLSESYTSQQANKWKDLFGTSLRERIDMISANSFSAIGNSRDGTAVRAMVQITDANDSPDGGAPGFSNSAPNHYPSTAPFSANQIELLWRPRSIGVFNISQHLPSGNYELELNPYINYNYNCVESCQNKYTILPAGTNAPTAINQAMVEVEDFMFFLPTCASPEYISDTTYYLSLEEYQIQQKSAITSQQVLNYVVPWSTQSLTVALQTGTVGTQTIVPPNKFLNIRNFPYNLPALGALSSIDINSNNLKNLQIQYSKVYPKTQYSSRFSVVNGVQQLYQRYEDTFENSQSMWQTGQQEPFADTTNAITAIVPYTPAFGKDTAIPTLPAVFGYTTVDYLSRGALYCVNVSKPSDNRTTDCQITVEYNNDGNGITIGGADGRTGIDATGNPQVLLLSCFKKTAKIVMVNGSVASVESVQG